MRLRRSRALLAPPAIFGALLFLATLASAEGRATANVNFSAYPEKAQDCMYDAADDSKCGDGKDVPTINACFCGNKNDFISQVAFCVNKADKNSMGKVFDTLTTNCKNSNTPLEVSRSDFLAAKEPKSGTKASTTTSKTSTTAKPTSSSTSAASTTSAASITSATPTPTESPVNNDAGLSTGARTGIVAGASVAAAAILGAVGIFVWKRKRNHRNQDESHPMLSGGPGPRTSAMTTGAQDWGRDTEAGRESKWYAASDVSAQTPHQSWGYPTTAYSVSPGQTPAGQQLSPYHSPYASQQPSPQFAAPAVAGKPPQQPAVFELGGGEGVGSGPAEMPASPLQSGGAPQQPPAGWAAYRPPPPP